MKKKIKKILNFNVTFPIDMNAREQILRQKHTNIIPNRKATRRSHIEGLALVFVYLFP